MRLLFAVTIVVSITVEKVVSDDHSEGRWTKWFSDNKPAGKSEKELLAELDLHPCGGQDPLSIQVRVYDKGSWRYSLCTDQNIHVGPSFGLRCDRSENAFNGMTECHDYKILYVNRLMKKATDHWLNLHIPNRMNKHDGGEIEVPDQDPDKTRGGKAKKWKYLHFRTSPESPTKSYKMLYNVIKVGPTFGLSCLWSEQPFRHRCRDYGVRYLCKDTK